MPVPFHPGPEWYIAFHELDPSTDRQCIYYTQKEERCSWLSDDNERAIELHRLISRAKHRIRIEDRQELLPLAERWLDEAQRHVTATTYHPTSSVPTSEENDDNNRDTGTSQISSPNGATTSSSTPPSNAPSFESNQSILAIDGTLPKPVTNSPPKHPGVDAIESTIQSFESQTRYNLRPGNSNASTDSASSLASIYQAPQSDFAPHVTSPGPGDKVSQKLLDLLVADDFRTGSLYIFNRHSSPGHVKIGYTARSVAGRLAQWSKCGYTPNLLFEVDNVPCVRRAETLTHHELIKEWRRERRCNHGRGCASAHQEWFEISIERSSKVLGDWADFMKRAEPYDTAGRLKPQWKKFVELLDAKQEVVTAEILLGHYEISLVDNRTLVEELAALEIEEKESAGIESNVEDFKPAPFFGAQPSSKSAVPQRHTPPLEANSLFGTKLSAKTKEDMSLEQIPLPPSPLLQSTAYTDDKSSMGKMRETSSTTIEENENEPDPNGMASAPTELVPQARSPPVTQLSEALLNLRVHDQEEIRKTASSPSRCQQKATEEPQIDAETEFYIGDDTIIVADEEDESWGDDPTLAGGDQTLLLELAPLEIVDGLYNGIPTGKSRGILKSLDTATVLETELDSDREGRFEQERRASKKAMKDDVSYKAGSSEAELE